VFFIFSLVIETIGEKKVFDTQIGKRKTSFGIYNINFDISPAFFAFVVNLIKRKLETVSISSSEIVAVCCRSTLLTKKKT
jgi:hypothetical protein